MGKRDRVKGGKRGTVRDWRSGKRGKGKCCERGRVKGWRRG
jgi:hypothetical protein